MIKNNIIQFPPPCQEKFGDDPHYTIKIICTKHCEDLLKIENYPWGKNSDPIKYFIENGNTKLSKTQKKLINFFHKEYFSRGKACWLKRRNIIRHAKLLNMDKDNLTRAIKRLMKRGILLKITAEAKNKKIFVIIPNMYPYSDINKSKNYFDTWIKETDRGGTVRLCCN